MDLENIKSEIDVLISNAKNALREFDQFDQKKIDHIVKEMAIAGMDRHMYLAKLAIEETRRGVYEDKIIKNMFATEYIYHDIKNNKTVGIIHDHIDEDEVTVAEPIGVVVGVTPVTNPTSTTLFKSLICMKTRNPIIFAFHPGAQKCSVEAARIVKEAAIAAGAPKDCIQWIENPSVDATKYIMSHDGVDLILATGGTGMVKSAYMSGKPALGVGPGNVPCYIEKSANLKRSVTDLILSKTFDNGMICASEQGLIVDKEIYSEVKHLLTENHCYFTNPDETSKLSALVISEKTCSVNGDIVGKSAHSIAESVGISVSTDTKMLCVELPDATAEYPLSREKLSPVLAVFCAENTEHAMQLCEKMLALGGLGHSSVIHSNHKEIIDEFSRRMKTGRIIVNAPSSQGAIGDIYNTNVPSLTLGCGSYGKNSTTSNVSVENLLNVKRVARRKVNMQWFKIPERIYFEAGSIEYLRKMPHMKKAFIVTDKQMVQLGFVDKILNELNHRDESIHYEVFDDVEANPSFNTVLLGARNLSDFQPDTIIALGGGSPIDAAKGMWLLHEYPDIDFHDMKQKFMDIRKRIYKLPRIAKKCTFVAIPTTSGTGSEVTSFAVITDKTINVKYPLADYELTPNVAIIDPELVMTLPKVVTADTGLDTLTHAIEAYVSVLASDYTDALAVKAIELVFKNLKRAYDNGSTDIVAREKMHNAATMAGMAFTNAFLGINHSLAHKLGGEFDLSHGRANAILLPHVIKYNAVAVPTKFVSFPKYETYIAPTKYADIARRLNLPAYTDEEGIHSLIEAIKELMTSLEVPLTIQDCGVSEESFHQKLNYLAERAFEDQCTTANPRLPLVSELEQILKDAYYGNF